MTLCSVATNRTCRMQDEVGMRASMCMPFIPSCCVWMVGVDTLHRFCHQGDRLISLVWSRAEHHGPHYGADRWNEPTNWKANQAEDLEVPIKLSS